MDKIVNGFSFTLYEIFGYLLPGAIALFALAILFQGVQGPPYPSNLSYACALLNQPLDPGHVPDLEANALGLTFVLLAAYILGHVSQEVGNQIVSIVEFTARTRPCQWAYRRLASVHGWLLERLVRDNTPQQTAEDLRTVVVGRINDALKTTLRNDDIEDLCENVLLQHGKTDERDMHVYREGFYKGTAVSFMMLGIAVWLRLPRQGLSLKSHGYILLTSKATVLIILAVSLFFIVLRYYKFRKLRKTEPLAAFLALTEFSTKTGASQSLRAASGK